MSRNKKRGNYPISKKALIIVVRGYFVAGY